MLRELADLLLKIAEVWVVACQLGVSCWLWCLSATVCIYLLRPGIAFVIVVSVFRGLFLLQSGLVSVCHVAVGVRVMCVRLGLCYL